MRAHPSRGGGGDSSSLHIHRSRRFSAPPLNTTAQCIECRYEDLTRDSDQSS